MVCVPCILVPVILFLWALIKPIINWFRGPNVNAEDQTNAGDDDAICSLLSGCPCINKTANKLEDQAVETNAEKATLLEIEKETPAEVSDTNNKKIV